MTKSRRVGVDGPTASSAKCWVVEYTNRRRPSVDKVTLIAMDTSKHVFTLHGVDERGKVLLRRELRRQQLERFFAKLPPVDVVLEACGESITAAR